MSIQSSPMNDEQKIWSLAAKFAGCDPEDNGDDEEIQPYYDGLQKFAEYIIGDNIPNLKGAATIKFVNNTKDEQRKRAGLL